jgi:glycosyltransferase involved in cell wall biosynthesis
MTASSAIVEIGSSADRYWLAHDPESCHVAVNTRVRLRDFETPVSRASDMRLLRRLGEELSDLVAIDISATPKGGGVCMMIQVEEPISNELGVRRCWRVLTKDEEAFAITKMWHNTFQKVRGGGRFTAGQATYYWNWIAPIAQKLREELMRADVIIIHDPQPAGIVWFLRQWGYRGKIIFRNHIQSHGMDMVTPGTDQEIIWRFLRDECMLSTVNAYVAHPVPGVVPPDVPDDLVWLMPATYSRLDDLNRPITKDENEAGFDFINEQLLLNENQGPIDSLRRYILLFARFDWAKGMDLAMEHYAQARALAIARQVPESEIPDLVILGNGSQDDGDGPPVLAYMMELRRTKYAAIAEHIKIARVPHNDLAVNAVMRGAWLVIQPSTVEGFETRVSDAIDKGIPVIGTTGTGIEVQILPGLSGFVFDARDHHAWATCIVDLLVDQDWYLTLKRTTLEAAETHNYDFTTIPGLISWLYLIWNLVNDRPTAGNHQWLLPAARNDAALAA